MREAVRCQYLHAMGIPIWVPRHELPNAAPSQLLPWLGEQGGPHGSELPTGHLPNYHHAEDHSPGGHFAAELLQHRGTSTAIAETRGNAPAVPANVLARNPATASLKVPPVEPARTPSAPLPSEAVTVVDLTPPRFELHFVAMGGGAIWVCDGREQLQAMQAFALRVAAGMGWNQERGEPLSFRWPFIEHGKEDQSAAVAEQALRAQWQFFVHHGGRFVIGFGPRSGQWLTRIQVPGCYQDGDVFSVMNSAEQKKQLWLALLKLPMEQLPVEQS
tara:strand:- start:11 stop:832 length:822 start_codon:yes stop_codon:yes gene_type:complete